MPPSNKPPSNKPPPKTSFLQITLWGLIRGFTVCDRLCLTGAGLKSRQNVHVVSVEKYVKGAAGLKRHVKIRAKAYQSLSPELFMSCL